jgi:hypothetical protein
MVTQAERSGLLKACELPDGVLYIGEQPNFEGGTLALYQDVVTGSSFAVHVGETIEQAAKRIREAFFPDGLGAVWEA